LQFYGGQQASVGSRKQHMSGALHGLPSIVVSVRFDFR
jgi:hypothetical protein